MNKEQMKQLDTLKATNKDFTSIMDWRKDNTGLFRKYKTLLPQCIVVTAEGIKIGLKVIDESTTQYEISTGNERIVRFKVNRNEAENKFEMSEIHDITSLNGLFNDNGDNMPMILLAKLAILAEAFALKHYIRIFELTTLKNTCQ